MTTPPKAPITLNRQRLIQYFFFGVFLFLLYQLLLILSPFFVAILGSGILALMTYPFHAWIEKKMMKNNYPSLAAFTSTSAIVLIVVIPFMLFGWVFIKETAKVYPAAQDWIENAGSINAETKTLNLPPKLLHAWERSRVFLNSWNIDLQDIVLKNLNELSSEMTHVARRVIRNTVFVMFNIALLIFTLFFFFRDGPHIIHRVMELIPMTPEHKKVILDRIQDTLYAVLRGILIVAIVQGTLAGFGFWLFGVPFPALLGVLSTLLAPIPFIGTPSVWVPVSISLALTGDTYNAMAVAAWGMLVVGMIDNFLRPILIGTHAKIPLALLFFGLLGGMRVYGFLGLLLGPVIIALVLAFVNIYKQEYHWLLSPSKENTI